MRSSPCRRLVSTVVKHDLTSTTAGHPRCLVGPLGNLGVRTGTGSGSSRVRSQYQQQIRGKKTKTTVNLADLPQGPIKPPEAPLSSVQNEQDEGPSYPTVVLQARRNMVKFENCVLLTRVGGFYELYFEHAEEYGPLLNLKVASKKTNAGPVPMAGFPFFQLDRFLKILVQEFNFYVAIAEEFPNDASDKIKSNGLMHDRRVTRIITPGTLIDENFIDPYANNYVMAIHYLDQSAHSAVVAEIEPATEDGKPEGQPSPASAAVGLAWLDISTGQFYTQSTTLAGLPSILSRVGPREIVVDKRLQSQEDHALFAILAEDKHLITFTPHSSPLPTHNWTPMLESEITANTAKKFTEDEISAGSLLLQYVRDRLLGLSLKLQPPVRHESLQVLTIDKNSMRSLEIKETIRDGAFKGSLLHAIRRTVTKSGARLLNDWLSAPSTCIETITQRQELVEFFIQDPDLRDHITQLLRRSHDSQRLVQKFAFGRGDPDDLVGLANTIRATEEIVQLLPSSTNDNFSPFNDLLRRISLSEPVKLADRIRSSIDEDGISVQHQIEDSEAGQLLSLASDIVNNEATSEEAAEILSKSTVSKIKKSGNGKPTSIREHYDADNPTFTMKPGASAALSNFHSELNKLQQERVELTTALSARLGAPSLTLRWAPNFGHIVHVKGKDTKQIPTSLTPLTSSRSTRTFALPEWTTLGRSLHQTRFAISTEETRIFASLREHVVRNLIKLRRNASVLDELDIATSFARLATENGLVRPVLSVSNTSHKIIGGRHPTVELGLRIAGRSFSPNDCLVGDAPSQSGRLWLITGPNMAGKSTYLRQNALITILAQTGCFVPAAYAEIGIVDAIFSRVGSADNLYNDQSTFMVEMLETAQILRSATSRSFVIMDEIGRGTTPDDGTAVAFAALWHLVKVNKCRALFATHFHELADIVKARDMHVEQGGEVEFYCTDVAEDGYGGFVYVHKLGKGVNRQSHALKVAKLAGLPEAAITMAKEILGRHDKSH